MSPSLLSLLHVIYLNIHSLAILLLYTLLVLSWIAFRAALILKIFLRNFGHIDMTASYHAADFSAGHPCFPSVPLDPKDALLDWLGELW